MNELKETKICSRCGRELPLERFSGDKSWCKNCASFYSSESKGFITEDNMVKIERIYKEPESVKLIYSRIHKILCFQGLQYIFA